MSRPPGSTLESYTACYPEQDLENTHIKSIVNMDHVWRPGQDPHHFKYYVNLAAFLSTFFFTWIVWAGLIRSRVYSQCSGSLQEAVHEALQGGPLADAEASYPGAVLGRFRLMPHNCAHVL